MSAARSPLAVLAPLGCALAGLVACATPAPKANGPKALPAADAALLRQLPLSVDEKVLVNDEVLRGRVPALLEALRAAAAEEGFRVSAAPPGPGDLVLRATCDWTPPDQELKPSLFVTLALERDGERVDETFLRRAEAFPGDVDGVRALAHELVRPLARSPRTRDYLQAREP